MSRSEVLVRAGVVVAAGFLMLDGVLLLWAGASSGRPGLIAWGAVLGLLAALPVLLWRRYLRHMHEVRAARRAMAQEVRHFQTALRGPQH